MPTFSNTYFKIGSNQTERNTQAAVMIDGVERVSRVDFLYSYNTPVACYVRGDDTLYITNYKWSATTNRHINRYTAKFATHVKIVHVPQAVIDSLHHRANIWEAAQAGVEA